jgi:hypothetical protein
LKKTPLLITIGIVLLTIGGFYTYQQFFQKHVVRTWDLVPHDALLVYERDNCSSCIDEVSNSSFWNLLQEAAFYKRPPDSLQSKLFDVFKQTKGVLVSVHPTKKDDFDFIYFLPVTNQFSDIGLFKSNRYKTTKRKLNDEEITEVRFSGLVFSYVLIENNWIGSFTPFLIEDVIRSYHHDTGLSNPIRSAAFNSIKDDAGNLYVRLDNFPELVSLFFKDHSFKSLMPGKSTLLDIKGKTNEVILNGFSTDSVDHTRYLLSIFHHQSPVSFGLKHLISNRAVAVSSFGISEGDSFFDDLRSFNHKPSKIQFDSLQRMTSKVVNYKSLFETVNDEIAVCFFESSKRKTISRILLVETAKIKEWTTAFEKLALQYSIDSVFHEAYADYSIGEVPIFQFPQKLLSPLVDGFNHTYYTKIGNVLVIGETLEELKGYLDDIEAEDTWGKSVSKNRFLESTLLESNISLYINTSRIWSLLSDKMHPRWQGFVTENRKLLQSFQMSSIQFSHLNNSYYTNALFTFKPYEATKDNPTNNQRNITRFEKPLMNIYAVRSHVNRSNEILIQDSVNDLSLVSADGKVLWKLPIGDKIISEVTQIDYYNNGKLQYFFSTSDAVHIIDRLGNYVDPYPLHFTSMQIEHVSVIDWDNSKKYRILIVDVDGRLRMFDKEGKPLLGWDPNDMQGGLAMPPQHFRILGKDYVIGIRKDGVVYAWTRRGERIKNFPLATATTPAGNLFLERGSTLSETNFVFISSDGYRVKFNLQGKIQSKETLAKTSVFSNFALINEKSIKSYLIFQQDEKQFQVQTDEGVRLFSAPLTGLTFNDIKYFTFAGGKSFISVKDRSQGFVYIYDEQGNLLTSPPLEAQSIEIRPLSNDQFVMFFIHGNALIIQPL